jgi:hypothetical protein
MHGGHPEGANPYDAPKIGYFPLLQTRIYAKSAPSRASLRD